MHDQTDTQYVEDFRRRWAETSGYVYPQYGFLAERDPEFAEAFLQIMKAWRRKGPIPAQYKEMMILMGSCVKMQEMAIRTHLRKARKLGATDAELLELFEVVLLSGGGVAMVKAIGVFMEELGISNDALSGPEWD